LLQQGRVAEILPGEARILLAQRAVSDEEFADALGDARGRGRDALERVNDDRGDLAQRDEIIEAGVGDQKRERQRGEDQQAGKRSGAGLEERRGLMFYQR